MASFPNIPFFGDVTRIETTNIALGGDLVNQPNLALYQLVQRTEWLRNRFEGAPTVTTPIPNQTSFELGPNIVIDLTPIFDATEALTYTVELNTEPTKLDATISGTDLTLQFLEWTTGNTVDQVTATVQVRATDVSLRTADTAFTVQINNLSQLFTVPYFQFIYSASGSVNSGAAIYVDAAERDAILADPTLSVTFTLGRGGSPVFRAIDPANAQLPTAAIGVNIENVYRFRFTGTGAIDQGSYLYTGEAEAATVRGNPDFTEETSPGNPAFRAFIESKEREQRFARYRYTERQPIGDYIYSIGAEAPNVPPSTIQFEGNVCGVKQIT